MVKIYSFIARTANPSRRASVGIECVMVPLLLINIRADASWALAWDDHISVMMEPLLLVKVSFPLFPER